MRATHYDVLGITPDASAAFIRSAYRARMREAHPDSGGSETAAARLNEAFEVLGNEAARSEYDRELSRQAQPSPEAPASAPEPEPQEYAQTVREEPAYPAHYRPSGEAPRSIWSRPRTQRRLLIIAVVWAVVAAVMVALSGHRAATLDSSYPQVTGILVGVLPVAFIVMTVVRTKWILILAAFFGYSLFCASEGVSGYGAVMLAATIATCVALRCVLSASRKEQAREIVADFWIACENPELTGWFIARSMPDRQTCLVQLVDVTGAGRPDASVILWGHHAPGSYIVADLSTSPASVLLTATSQQMKVVQRDRRRSR